MRQEALKHLALIRSVNASFCSELVYLDGQKEIIRRQTPDLLEDWCTACGSSLQGRVDGIKKLIGVKRKFPVLIRESDRLILFPLRGASYPDENYWINDSNLVHAEPIGRTAANLVFVSGLKLTIPFDCRIIRHQRDVCQIYRSALNQSMKEL